ncbi:MAG: ATP-binding protein [Candidatus Dependentiae bacterium]|nr:ATP-binding protein [Candidatus Dependentiae bacterium]
MKKLPLGIQTFTKIIETNCVYVDKTEHIYRLIQGDCFFFARPRRFGKSLLCSTLEDLFLGKKELFKGLWIDKNTDYQWPVHPVIHLDLSQVDRKHPEALNASLMRTIDDIAEQNEVGKLEHTTPGEMLKKLTLHLFKKFGSKNRVVLIIDEYDKPILDTIEKPEIAHEMREVLKHFYEFIKGLDEYLRFVFITGVTRFSKTSVFSGLNQLVNISMDPQFAHLVGYTEDEIAFYFHDHLQEIIDTHKVPAAGGIDELEATIQRWYNGYRFWKDLPRKEGADIARLYTPFSVLNFLYAGDFSNYWFESGTPSFLLKIFEQQHYSIESFEHLTADMNELMTFDIPNIPLTTLLFQSGYATIKSYDEASQCYSLEMPNYEVKDSLLKSIVASMTAQRVSTISGMLAGLRRALGIGNVGTFIDTIKKFYATVPYTIAIDKERYYQTIFFIVLQLVNLRPDVEKATNIGRIDLVVEANNTIYIFEFKLNKSAQEALNQIIDMHYDETYHEHGKKLVLVGVNFSSDTKNITEFITKELF